MKMQSWDERLKKKSDQSIITQMEINFAMAEEIRELRELIGELGVRLSEGYELLKLLECDQALPQMRRIKSAIAISEEC